MLIHNQFLVLPAYFLTMIYPNLHQIPMGTYGQRAQSQQDFHRPGAPTNSLRQSTEIRIEFILYHYILLMPDIPWTPERWTLV